MVERSLILTTPPFTLPLSVEGAMHQHLRGQRHNLAVRRAATAARAIYIRGFPPGQEVQEPELQGLFQQFGTVSKVSIDIKRVSCVAPPFDVSF